jgi:large subunit ribosomal protein L29
MELEKIRNLSDQELGVEGNKAVEQLFRLRFQLTLGQTDVVKKVRLLKKDIARIKTIERERQLHLHGAEHKTESSAAPKAHKAAKKAAAKKAAAAVEADTDAVAVAEKAPAKKAAKKTAKKSTTKEAR